MPSFLVTVPFTALAAAYDAHGHLRALRRCANVMVQFDTMDQLSSRVDVVRAAVDGARGGNTVVIRFWSATEQPREVPVPIFNVMHGHLLTETTSSVPMYVVVHGMMLARFRTLVDENVVLEDMSSRFLQHVSGTMQPHCGPEYLPTIRNTPMAHRAVMHLNRMFLDGLRQERDIHMDKLFTCLVVVMHYVRMSRSSKSTVSVGTGWFVSGLFRMLATMLRFYNIEYTKGAEFRLYNMVRYNYRDAVVSVQKMVAKLNTAGYSRHPVCVDDARMSALLAEWRSTSAVVYMTAQYVPVRGRASSAEQQSKRAAAMAELRVLNQQLQTCRRRVERSLVRARQVPVRVIDIGLLDTMLRMQACMCTDPYQRMNALYRHTVPSLVGAMASASGPARAAMLLRVIRGIVLSTVFTYRRDDALRYTHGCLMTTALAMVTRRVDSITLPASSAVYMSTAVRPCSCIHLLDPADVQNLMQHAMAMFFGMPRFILRQHGMQLLHAMMQTMVLSETCTSNMLTASKRMRLNCGAPLFDPMAAFYGIPR